MKLIKILLNQFVKMILHSVIRFNYELEAYTSAGSEIVSISGRVTKLKISHILIAIRGVALIATELPKLILNMTISDGNKNIVTNVDLLNLAYLCDIDFGTSLTSTTDARILVPVGTMDTKNFDINYKILGTSALAANAMTIDITGHLLDEKLPITCLEKKAFPVSPVSMKNVIRLFDCSTAYNSAVESILTFDNNSQMKVKHKTAFHLAQLVGKLETANTFGLIYNDKDMSLGRDFTLLTNTAFNGIVHSVFR